MGSIRMIYDETSNQLKKLGSCRQLSLEETREMMSRRLRYCLQDNFLYLPKDQSALEQSHRLSWIRARVDDFYENPWMQYFNEQFPLDIHAVKDLGLDLGTHYCKRHLELDGKRQSVTEFCGQSIIDEIVANPEALEDVSKRDFETLMAELFARMGYDVELYRGTKDEGIDFLAISSDDADPMITCVQCKHPDKVGTDKKRRTLPVATVREVYGVAKANNFDSCLSITSSDYSPDAKKFAEKKPGEIHLANADDILNWLLKFRWNKDE